MTSLQMPKVDKSILSNNTDKMAKTSLSSKF